MKKHFILAKKYLIGLLNRKLLGKNVRALIVRTENGLFAVDPEDWDLGRVLRKHRKYGSAELERLKRYLDPASRVLVVGAHIGIFAIPLSKWCKEVLAIEANPDTYGLLETNIALNGAADCRPIQIAASDKEEDLEFLLSRANSGGSKRLPKIHHYMYYYDNPRQVTVHAVALDGYLEKDRFDLIVMDIEGSEYFALKGMKNILRNSNVLVVEFLPHHLKNVSGITVKQFLSVLPDYETLTIPSLGIQVDSSMFLSTLEEMETQDLEDGGIIFEKAKRKLHVQLPPTHETQTPDDRHNHAR